MQTTKILFLMPLFILGIILIPPNIAKGDVATCDAVTQTCWVFDSIESVNIFNWFLVGASGLHIKGMVGAVEKDVAIAIPESGDPIYRDVINNCYKVALLAQVSPEKGSLRIDTSAAESNDAVFVNVDSADDVLYCYLITQSAP